MATINNDSLDVLTIAMRKFAQDREWEQFHSPKNLSMALAGETAELLDCFRWLTEEASYQLDAEQLSAVQDELADVLLFTVRLADQLNLDLFAAAQQKMASAIPLKK